MRFRVLGPLEVDDEGRKVALGGPTPRTLLAILLLRRGEVVPADQLIEQLYGGVPPAKATKSVHAHVSRLRKSLGDDRLRTAGGGYAVDISPGELDVDRFDELADQGRGALASGDPEAALHALQEALALWRGAPFVDFRYSDFAQTEIARLEERRLGVLEDRMEAELALGRHGDVVPELNAIVADHPLRERPRAQLMVALYRSGRQAEALEAYQEARRVLVDELGIEPGEELKRLQRAILEHDPALATPDRDDDTPAKSRGDFVGRQAELSAVREAIAGARAGHGSLLLISGEPGIGKSRLADELMTDARSKGMRVVIGRCWEAGGAPAYWPWVQSLRAYIHDADPEDLRAQLGSGASELAQLFPELEELFPGLAAPLPTEGEGARFRLFDAAATFLKAASRSRPLVIVLDDLHAADEPSLLLLRFLSRELRESRLLVAGLYRDVDPTVREPLAAALAELAREPVTRRLSLSGLAPPEVADFVEHVMDTTPSDALVAAIYEESGGNPLFVSEVVRLLDAEGHLSSATAPISIPPGVREVIERRVLRLGHDTARLLVLASVLGREFELETVARVGGLSAERTLSSLDEALAERIVGEVPGSRGRFRFAHELIRDTVYGSLSAARRVRLHREAGEALEALYADDLAPHLAELAHHFAEAAPAGDDRKAVEYARRAGDRALTLLAFEEAVRLYETALDLAGSEHSERCEMLLQLGEAQARAGDTPAAKDTFRAAAELAERLGRPDQLARAALGYGGRIMWAVFRDDPHLLPLLERALSSLGEEDSELRVMVLARLAAGPLRDASFDPSRRAAYSAEALAMARRLGEPATLAYALSSFVDANHSPDGVHRTIEVASELITTATGAGDLERAVEGYENRGTSLLSIGDAAGAKRDLQAMEQLARELRQPAQEWYVAEVQASSTLLTGHLDDGESQIEHALEIGERALSWNARVSYRLQMYVLRRHQGRLAEVEDMVRRSVSEHPTYLIWDCVMAHVAAVLELEAEARDLVDRHRLQEFASLRFDEMWLGSMALLADAACSLRHVEGAAALYPRLLPYGDRAVTTYPELCLGALSRNLGSLASILGRFDDAERHFEAALRMNSRIDARTWLALTHHDYARMLHTRSDPGDAGRAETLEASARKLAADIGMRLPDPSVSSSGAELGA